MPNHMGGKGRNVALPEPAWRPEDSSRDDRERYSSHWTDEREPAPRGHRGKGPLNYQRSDERIREAVCELLTEDDRIDASQMEVHVANGDVTLTGTVDDRSAKRLAEEIVEIVWGICDIQNQLRVGDKPSNQPAGREVGMDQEGGKRHRA